MLKFPFITRRKHQTKITTFTQNLKEKIARLEEENKCLQKKLSSLRTPSIPEKYQQCPACGKEGIKFLNIDKSFIQNLFDSECIQPIFTAENPNFLNYTCQNCGATDRERLIIEYLRISLRQNLETYDFKILEIAPGPSTSKWIQSNHGVIYRTGDLLRDDVDDNFDITNMSLYEDNSFDTIICSHVLEHVPDDRSALRELFRITKPGGECLLLAPILLGLESDYENIHFETALEKWRYFMQDDHVRVYSKIGFSSKIKNAGFTLVELNSSYFGPERLNEIGVHSRTVLYCAKKLIS